MCIFLYAMILFIGFSSEEFCATFFCAYEIIEIFADKATRTTKEEHRKKHFGCRLGMILKRMKNEP